MSDIKRQGIYTFTPENAVLLPVGHERWDEDPEMDEENIGNGIVIVL
jgi:hypothetical protein